MALVPVHGGLDNLVNRVLPFSKRKALLAEAADMPDAARETYEANTAEALERGVFGAPFFIVGDEMFWGQDRLPHLDWYLGTLDT